MVSPSAAADREAAMAIETPPQKPTQRPSMPVHHAVPPPQPPDDDRDEPALNDGELLPDGKEPLENEQSPQMPNVYRTPQ
jgi:hypothetical protein